MLNMSYVCPVFLFVQNDNAKVDGKYLTKKILVLVSAWTLLLWSWS